MDLAADSERVRLEAVSRSIDIERFSMIAYETCRVLHYHIFGGARSEQFRRIHDFHTTFDSTSCRSVSCEPRYAPTSATLEQSSPRNSPQIAS
jgi:hypothetical protein